MKSIEEFQSIIYELFFANKGWGSFLDIDLKELLKNRRDEDAGTAETLNAAFLVAICGNRHPEQESAVNLLKQLSESSRFAETAKFYLTGMDLVFNEINEISGHDSDFSNRLKSLSTWLLQAKGTQDPDLVLEKAWSVFFPEANGIRSNIVTAIDSLRLKRSISIKELNRTPITDPASEILFTSNILLTLPEKFNEFERLFLSKSVKEKLIPILNEKQIFWYDHPIQMGVEPNKNEVLYGLRGLDNAFSFEKERGNMPEDARALCALSVSVTHHGIQGVAKEYLEEQLKESGGLNNIDVYVFSEEKTKKILEDVIYPVASHYFGFDETDARASMSVFGVNGEYGRHYSFLKALAALWGVLIVPELKGTFKIDLDQVFPQDVLVEQTGTSAFEHFMTPLWGSRGVDYWGRSIELGMIAGALVNEKDISKSLFFPDVGFPDREPDPDEYIFYSTLPQALSTEAEMMARYNDKNQNGEVHCIKRFHVTGGTNGILINSLRKYRPFTPSFIGRAEDQAYILSVLLKQNPCLGYVHKEGLIMRHDKEAFAEEAIESARVSKLIGDYLRILYFSVYAKLLSGDVSEIKMELDPFTGCFISKIPMTVVFLRFALKVASLTASGKREDTLEFIQHGVSRITSAVRFVSGKESLMSKQFRKEKKGWDIFYDTIQALEDGLKNNDEFALRIKARAESLIDGCLIHF